jgi:hypothetical protein
MPITDPSEALKLINLRQPEYTEHALRWRWLLDSLEGGERYRQAVYGYDSRGLPIRNLIRHKREYPDPREYAVAANSKSAYIAGTAQGIAGVGFGGNRPTSDQAQYADVDDYELRRARTPVPMFVEESVDAFLSKIYSNEIDREAPESPGYEGLRQWWANVDGRSSSIDEWMADTIASLLVTLGQIDLVFDHPAATDGEKIDTEADVLRLNLKGCVATYVLPENMTWWRLDSAGNYEECLYKEYADGGDGSAPAEGRLGVTTTQYEARWRHWTATESNLYGLDGKLIASKPHNFGRVPIIRVFDRCKPRCSNVGISRMEGIAEQQREFYNRDSELILSDTTQAHPLLQGPEDYVKEDGSIPIGPGWLLPKKKNAQGGAVSYEGFSVVDFPKGAADSIRKNKEDIREAVDRAACLTKPAGAKGTSGGMVSQSGVSKELDHDGLHRKLSKISKTLAKAERQAACMAMLVLFDGNPPPTADADIKITYPTVFSLYAADDIAKILGDLQSTLAAAGEAPETETAMICEIVRKALPGRDDETYELFDAEIRAAIETKAKAVAQRSEGQLAGGMDQEASEGPGEMTEADEEYDEQPREFAEDTD